MGKRILIGALAAAVVTGAVSVPSAGAAVTVGHSGWTWGNPLPQGHSLFDVDFIGSRGYAVGEFGTVLRTDDGGTSWTGLQVNPTDEGYGILDVINPDTFVVGGGCTLLRFDSGGSDVRRLRFTTRCDSPLQSFHFPNTDTGFILRGDGRVLRTEDGGRTFASRMTVPEAGALQPSEILFTSTTRGFVVSGDAAQGRIYRTTDGGGTWTPVQPAGGVGAVRDLVFVDATTGYAVGEQFLRTTNGGDSWEVVSDPAASLRTIRCADLLRCVMGTTNGQIHQTSNGGADVSPATTGSPPVTVEATTGAYASATRAVAVGPGGRTLLSNDGGETFAFSSSSVPGAYHRVRSTSNMVAHVAGDAGAIARTVDGGQTWSQLGVPTPNTIQDVAFPNANLGFALDTDGAVFRTDNGGASWAIQSSNAPANAIIASSDGNVVLLIGPTGVRRSANGGEQFDAVDGAPAETARLISGTYNSGTGVLTLFGPRALLFSSNNGESFTSLRRPGRSSIRDVDFVDARARRGFALTSDGRVWRTSNRGRAWSELRGVGDNDAYSLDMSDRRNGWLAVDDFAGDELGWVLRTSDGGATWRPELIDSSGVAREGLGAAAGPFAFLLTQGSPAHLFYSADDGRDASTISINAPRRIARRGRVRVTGRITPAQPGDTVEISTRTATSNSWRSDEVTVRSDGTFRATFTVPRTSLFVAQWAGDADHSGDGSPVRTVRVGR
jgi:photosystem II stability/assembly factor-like uncharacterized protein